MQSDVIIFCIFTTFSNMSCCSVLFLCSGIFWDTDGCQFSCCKCAFISTVAILEYSSALYSGDF